MSIKNFMFAVICSATLFGCSLSSQNVEKSAGQIYGSYTATLPCASCSGIEQILTLKDDNTYVLQSNYLDEKDGKFTDKGNYSIENGIITTTNEFKEKNYYKIDGQNLRMLDSDKKITTGPLEKFYIFKPYRK
ncbi:copper resistance protein NlpE [Campylobacter sputorum]|uniref:copper resistance protein NlpE n=1 Tax=Campylobacter sputorum TaxID=206 RepID=UPI00068C3550|nr:copper resistance protein NlpE [Campylobacter sputorum]